jgi:uncharacterized peroxidase-related enzyme
MAYINVADGVPGIRSLVMFRPESGQYLYELAQVLLRGPSPLTPAEREMIAAYVSSRNNCNFCMKSHAAAARCLLGNDAGVMDDVLKDEFPDGVSEKLKALLVIAGKVQESGRNVMQEDVDKARAAGATDMDIHDAVLIAATFSMFNRYVDGLNSFTPENNDEYVPMGKRMAENGYVLPKPSK